MTWADGLIEGFSILFAVVVYGLLVYFGLVVRVAGGVVGGV